MYLTNIKIKVTKKLTKLIMFCKKTINQSKLESLELNSNNYNELFEII